MSSVSQDPAYHRLKDHLIASTGLAFYGDRDQELAACIDRRLLDLRLPDCSSYIDFLADRDESGAELDILIVKLTIGETYFFRDPELFVAIRDIILPDILERKQSSRELRIWSAGCANGAEPYSLVILLMREMADQIAGWKVGIDATDLNPSYLAMAAAGKFRAAALRSTPDEVQHECFSRDGLIWTIRPRYKQWVSFHRMNLVDSEFPMPWAAATRFDLILCRNVMIYFVPEANRRLVDQFHKSLADGGWLIVGGTEHNLDNYKAFRTVNATGTKFYQKTTDGQMKVAREPPSPPPRQVAALRPPARPLAKAPVEPGRAEIAGMEGLRQLADRGDWQGAAEYSQRLLTQDRLNPEIHFYRALIFENLGILDESERSLRQAVYLDRNFALAHYHLGLALKRDRHLRAAARSFENVLKVLAGMPGHAMVTAGPGVTVTRLRELAKMHLENSSGL